MGAGLLVGTALAVIIPEGVHTLYETQAGKLFFCNLQLTLVNLVTSEHLERIARQFESWCILTLKTNSRNWSKVVSLGH